MNYKSIMQSSTGQLPCVSNKGDVDIIVAIAISDAEAAWGVSVGTRRFGF